MLSELRIGYSIVKASRIVHFVKSSPKLYAFLKGAAEGFLSVPIASTLRSLTSPHVNGWDDFLNDFSKQMTSENFASTMVQV